MGEDAKNAPDMDETRIADVRPETRETLPGDAANREGQIIGPYRFRRKLGEGGMEEVWEATQEKPVRRTVALKVINWGMDTQQVVARFESERQALALMDHPTIAKVFDAGGTERGRPYFVMEYVKGIPITEYCDRHRLTTAERLKLLAEVCRGVHHAHQKGIIHRDIKPSNVLVKIEDQKAVPNPAAEQVEQLAGSGPQSERGEACGSARAARTAFPAPCSARGCKGALPPV